MLRAVVISRRSLWGAQRVRPAVVAQKLGDSDELWNSLDGIFACVLVDEATGDFVAARDPIGVCSFYWGKGRDGSTWFASEMKALQAHCETFDIFPPVGRHPPLCCIALHLEQLVRWVTAF